MRKTSPIAWVLLVIIVVGGIWYWIDSKRPPTTGQHAPPANQFVEGNLLLGIDSNRNLGQYLFGYNGMALYTNVNDAPNTSSCTGRCAQEWPPYLITSTNSLANLQAGVKGEARAIPHDEDTLQVTYNGKPLYFYAGDKSSGDTKGDGVGRVWVIARP